MKKSDRSSPSSALADRITRTLRSFALVCAGAYVSGTSLSTVRAGTFTWDGGFGNASWSQANNWAGDTLPTFDNTADLIFWSATVSADTAIIADRTVRSLTFNDNIDAATIVYTANGTSDTTDRVLTFEADSGNAGITVDSGAEGDITIGATKGTIVLNSSIDVVHNGTGILLVNRAISGAGGITKTGTGTLRLNRGNSFTGGVNINEGTVLDDTYLGGASMLGLGTGTVTLAGGELLLERIYNANHSSGLTIDTAAATSSTLTYNDLSAATRNFTLGGTASLADNLFVNNTSSAGGADVIVWNKATSGAGTLSYSGTNDDVLNNTNDNRFQVSGDLSGLTGGIEIRKGTWLANGANSLSGGAVSIGVAASADSAAINFNSNSPTAIANDINVRSGAGTRLINNGSGANVGYTGSMTLDGTLTYQDNGQDDDLNGDISGAGALVKRGTGTLDIRGNNGGYSGGVTVEEGTLRTINTSIGSGDISIAAGATYNHQQTSGSLLLSNNISGDGGMIVGGGNLVALSGNITNTGDINVNSATNFRIDNAALNASTANLSLNHANATLRLNASAADQTIANAVSGTGKLVKQGDFTTTLSGTNSYDGTTDVNAGTLVVNGNNAAATGAVTVATGATLAGSGSIGGVSTVLGTHAPGTSPGVQSFVSDLIYSGGASAVIWELTANTVSLGDRGTFFDGINVGGNLDFAGTTTLTLDFDLSGSLVDWSDLVWGGNQSWLLYDVAGTTTNLPNFSLLTENWTDKDGDLFDTVLAGSTFDLSLLGNDVYLNFNAGSVIPEPSRLLLLGLAVFGIVIRRRRL